MNHRSQNMDHNARITEHGSQKMFRVPCSVANDSRGYTLIEMLVYVLIFTMLSVVVINSLIQMTKSFAESRTNRDLLDAGGSAMERMSREVRGAISIDVSGSTLGSSPGALKLNTTDSGGTAKTVLFTVSGSPAQLQLTENGTASGALTNPNVSVSSLTFSQITTAQGTAVRIQLTLTDVRGTSGRTADFYDTVILRGAY